MRKVIKWLFIPLSIFLLAACNSDKVTEVPVTTPSNPDSAANENQPTASLAFTKFSLEVSYGLTEKYEADYENDNEGIEAEIDDKVNGEKLKGNDAYAKLEPLLQKLAFDATTDNATIAAEVLDAFGLSTDYTEFELEVRFTDGTQKEFKLNQ
ncbi:YusW family protein [Metasolibacillus sp.]|uniref:YusW family protein n=1 Tax=Metasolibacillus sp. TaxID=2703680 RepID=UPI0025EA4647|nr:YusW family protein [Metasolibacillus sp.]MCT6925098.1 YusW family protein [Metasolibacillus sp.]MCT6941302.1 YusW family protein [Metasolibacillus sp.]